MTDRDRRLETAKQLAQRQGAHEAPSAEPFVPELRSNVKWKPAAGAQPPILRDEGIMVVWRYGVPFKDIPGFHGWLAAEEPRLSGECAGLTNNKVHYLGTYLHIDTGSARYETFWGFTPDQTGEVEDAEAALANALTNVPFGNRVKILRGYWVRDPGATDHRYGMAAMYLDFTNAGGGSDSPFWATTTAAVNEAPQ